METPLTAALEVGIHGMEVLGLESQHGSGRHAPIQPPGCHDCGEGIFGRNRTLTPQRQDQIGAERSPAGILTVAAVAICSVALPPLVGDGIEGIARRRMVSRGRVLGQAGDRGEQGQHEGDGSSVHESESMDGRPGWELG